MRFAIYCYIRLLYNGTRLYVIQLNDHHIIYVIDINTCWLTCFIMTKILNMFREMVFFTDTSKYPLVCELLFLLPPFKLLIPHRLSLWLVMISSVSSLTILLVDQSIFPGQWQHPTFFIELWSDSQLPEFTLIYIWRLVCQKQVSRAGTSNYIPQILWDVITCLCPW